MRLPTLWRWAMRPYLKMCALSFFGLVACLLLMRIQEIAHFITIMPHFSTALFFIAYQIPYIFPFALPVAALIAAYHRFYQLTVSHELTALRASGIGMKCLLYPLALYPIFLGILNFTLASELVPIARYQGKRLLHQVCQGNPLSVLQSDFWMKLPGRWVSAQTLELPHRAGQVFIAFFNPTTQAIQLLHADDLVFRNHMLQGSHVFFLAQAQETAIDYYESTEIPAGQLTPFIAFPHRENLFEFLPMSELLHLDNAYYEILRRIYFFLVILAFTAIGWAFGWQTGRTVKAWSLIWTVIAAVSLFACFMAGKHMTTILSCAATLLLPPLLIGGLSLVLFNRKIRGLA